MKFDERLAMVSDKISRQKHLRTIKDAFMLTLPLTLIGSISLLLASPPITETTNSILLAIKEFSAANPALMIPYQMTTGIYGLWVVIAVAYCHAKQCKVNELSAVFIAATCFVCIAGAPVQNAIPMANIGSKGIFGAMILGIVCVEAFSWFVRKGIKIKMPDSVPPGVSAPFEALIAFGVILIAVMMINSGFIAMFEMDFITSTMAVFRPLIMSSDTIFALIVCVVLQRVLWFFGIHGGSVTNAILNPILMANLVANQEAFAAGEALPHVFTSPVFSGSMWGLSFLPAALVMIFYCKSARLKAVGKLGSIPALCGIGEPINFGTPFVLNTALLIPGILQFVFNCSVVFLCMEFGIINRVVVAPPMGIPTCIGVVLASMDYRALVLWVLLLAIDIVMYIPFFRIYDKQCLKEEAMEKQEAELKRV